MYSLNGSSVRYHYDAYHLLKIERYDSINQLSYECQCTDYDLHGNLLKEVSPAGSVVYQYDLLNRPISIVSSIWKAHLTEFDPEGNLLHYKLTDPSGEVLERFSYDHFNQLTSESLIHSNQFTYDSIGNCVIKNNLERNHNKLNQIIHDEENDFKYDVNGNLIEQVNPSILYKYDALDRLVSIEKSDSKTAFTYDSFGRCIEITDNSGKRQIIYQGHHEIGSILNGTLDEFRLIHPKKAFEKTFAVELRGISYFALQDHRYNICALQRSDGSIAQWSRFSAFGNEKLEIDEPLLSNPWRFANRRQVEGLSIFNHRFYNPHLMRWMNPDPIGFEGGILCK